MKNVEIELKRYSSKGRVLELFYSSVQLFGRLGRLDDCEYGSLQIVPIKVMILLLESQIEHLCSNKLFFSLG